MSRSVALLCLLTLSLPICAQQRKKVTTSSEFVSEFIRQIEDLEDIRSENATEYGAAKSDGERMMISIHMCTQMMSELRLDSGRLKHMQLQKPLSQLAEIIVNGNETKIDHYRKIKETSAIFATATPKPNVDYEKAATSLPELRANIEDVDKTLAKDVTSAIFLGIRDEKKAKMLTITEKERVSIIDRITTHFGDKLNADPMPYFVFSAKLLRTLLQDARGIDESSIAQD